MHILLHYIYLWLFLLPSKFIWWPIYQFYIWFHRRAIRLMQTIHMLKLRTTASIQVNYFFNKTFDKSESASLSTDWSQKTILLVYVTRQKHSCVVCDQAPFQKLDRSSWFILEQPSYPNLNTRNVVRIHKTISKLES